MVAREVVVVQIRVVGVVEMYRHRRGVVVVVREVALAASRVWVVEEQ